MASPMFGKKLRLKTKYEKSKFDVFIDCYNKFVSFTGAASQKHKYLLNLHNQVSEIMQDPSRFIKEC